MELNHKRKYIEIMLDSGVRRKVASRHLMSKCVKNKFLYTLLFPFSFWYCRKYNFFIEQVLESEDKDDVYFWVNYYYHDIFDSRFSQISGLRPSVTKMLAYFKDVQSKLSQQDS